MRQIKFRTFYKDENILYRDVDISSECLPIDDENVVIMQYTGLKDKNGVEIYEGDIVAHIPKHECNYIIKYLSSGFYICPNNENYGEYFTSLFAGFDDKNKCNSIEVIGNIYENTELLESKC